MHTNYILRFNLYNIIHLFIVMMFQVDFDFQVFPFECISRRQSFYFTFSIFLSEIIPECKNVASLLFIICFSFLIRFFRTPFFYAVCHRYHKIAKDLVALGEWMCEKE